MFLAHFRNGCCFRKLLYGNNKSFELNFVSKYQDSTKFFMLNLLLAISCGPQMHGMASELTFRKVPNFLFHINKAFYCPFQKKIVFNIGVSDGLWKLKLSEENIVGYI